MLASNELLIQKAGIHTSIQDLGRHGYRSKGVASSGSVDYFSAYLANWLVGNPADYALLETAFQGLSIRFKSSCFIAMTGADLGAELNGKPIKRYQTVQIMAGDELIFRRRISGVFAYLAVAGGLDHQQIMNSASMHSMIDLGSGKITAGSTLHFNRTEKLPPQRSVPIDLIPVYGQHFTARITRGPEYDQFPGSFVEQLARESVKVTTDSNRMGFRLKGNFLNKGVSKGILSSAVIPGTIQITSSGQPIILMNDGPTTGGYPRVANIISSDLNHVAQLGPGDSLRFKWISFEEAEELFTRYLELLSQFI